MVAGAPLFLIDYPLIILLCLHLGGVVSWLGATVLFVSVIEPSMKFMDHDAASDFLARVIPRLARFSIAVSALTLLAGFFLFDYISTTHAYLLPSPRILFIYAGGILGFFAFVIVATGMLNASNKIRNASVKLTVNGASESSGVSLDQVASSVRGTLVASSYILVTILVLMILGANF